MILWSYWRSGVVYGDSIDGRDSGGGRGICRVVDVTIVGHDGLIITDDNHSGHVLTIMFIAEYPHAHYRIRRSPPNPLLH